MEINIKKDITGLRFGRLIAIKPVGKANNGHTIWLTKCDCGNEKEIIGTNLTKKTNPTQSCGCFRKETVSKLRTGENHYNWKNGEGSINGKGYREFRHGELRGVRVHRYVYEQHYGIKLTPNQNIHHINGDRLDNRIENLELWDTTQPCGQRVEDKINFYFELVEKYKDHPLYKHLIKNPTR
jgi:hypothetical protein